MNKKYVLDANALVVLFHQDQGFAKVNRLLKDSLQAKHSILMSAVNWSEAYGVILRVQGEASAQRARIVLPGLPIELVSVTPEMAVLAAEIRVHHQMALADSFAAALAIAHHATLVTGDSDFQKVARRVSILWLRGP